MGSVHATVGLSSEQQQILTRTAKQICGQGSFFHSRLRRTGAEGSVQYPPDWLKMPRQSNCFGVFGPRGAGKTTVLVKLLDAIEKCYVHAGARGDPLECPLQRNAAASVEWIHSVAMTIPQYHVVKKVLDGSLAPADIPLGLTLVKYLWDTLHGSDSSDPRSARVSPARETLRRFELVEEAYLRAAPSYHRFVRDTAVSPHHYAQVAIKEIGERYKLPQRVWNWLEAEADALKVTGFVMVIDDVDLTPSGLAHFLLWSLLDELHQPRLLLLLGADIDLLEREVVWPRRCSAVNLKTARDLLYKVIPQDCREFLRPWPPARRLSFPPDDLGDASKDFCPCVSEREHDQTRTGQKDAKPLPRPVTIETLLVHLARDADHADLLRQRPYLLPPYPRGLETLRQRLWEASLLVPQKEGPSNVSNSPTIPGVRTAGEFLADLAESRGDYALSRDLPSRPPEYWATTFRWEGLSLGRSAWRSLADSARHFDSPLLYYVLPSASALRLQELAGEDVVLWAEYLSDLALKKRSLQPEDLKTRFSPLEDKFSKDTVARTDFTIQELERDFLQARPTILAEMFWFSWEEPMEPVPATVGLVPFLQSIGGERSALPDRLLAFLGFGREEILSGVSPDHRNVERYRTRPELLPRSVRGLILLADALSGLPWEVLSVQRRRNSVGTMARLAAGLTRAGYLRALRRLTGQPDGPTDEEKNLPDAPFLQAYMLGGEAELFQWEDEEVRERFNRLVDSDASQALRFPADPHHPLFKDLKECFDEFVHHPAFCDLQWK